MLLSGGPTTRWRIHNEDTAEITHHDDPCFGWTTTVSDNRAITGLQAEKQSSLVSTLLPYPAVRSTCHEKIRINRRYYIARDVVNKARFIKHSGPWKPNRIVRVSLQLPNIDLIKTSKFTKVTNYVTVFHLEDIMRQRSEPQSSHW